ncbi:type I-E CRISPR-associated protein Cas6/Cse3/CasE [Candidatus Entotheonella palauensis]|uniref:type I-E CRISPR-associated protein Cas6/Cse3/CasE n=1 Tax=Candidatus Entotheonella palauensis TaxID=93172 RepID=UPI0015C49758|nr:type I-E CRISPR-associated protein Cas6/Cse3/CasE [Candidatus Entotheonella palauensis]
MFFSKIELRREAEQCARVAQVMTQDGYRLHQALWQLFLAPPGTPRDFLYRQLETAHWPSFYVLSARQPVDTRGVWSIQSKSYVPQLAAGQRLAFSLCANPVVTKLGPHGKPVRHDVIKNAKQLRQNRAEPPIPLGALMAQEGETWLHNRAERCGFHVEQVRVDGYRQHQFRKARSGNWVKFSTLDFDGLLTVVDPELFGHTLYTGLGPAKSFGCGLLLIRRV